MKGIVLPGVKSKDHAERLGAIYEIVNLSGESINRECEHFFQMSEYFIFSVSAVAELSICSRSVYRQPGVIG